MVHVVVLDSTPYFLLLVVIIGAYTLQVVLTHYTANGVNTAVLGVFLLIVLSGSGANLPLLTHIVIHSIA